MDNYISMLEEYTSAMNEEEIAVIVKRAEELSVNNRTTDVYKLCYSAIDLTTLTESDNRESVEAFVKKAVYFEKVYPHIPNVATICVHPSFVDVVGIGVGENLYQIG